MLLDWHIFYPSSTFPEVCAKRTECFLVQLCEGFYDCISKNLALVFHLGHNLTCAKRIERGVSSVSRHILDRGGICPLLDSCHEMPGTRQTKQNLNVKEVKNIASPQTPRLLTVWYISI